MITVQWGTEKPSMTLEDAVMVVINRRIEAARNEEGKVHCQVSVRSVGRAALKLLDMQRNSGTSRRAFLIADRLLKSVNGRVCGFTHIKIKTAEYREKYWSWRKYNDERLLSYRIYEVIAE